MNESNRINGCGTNESHRWWDVYVIRYAVGIVVGAICIHYLFKNFNVDIEKVLFSSNEADAKDVYTSWLTLVLYGVYGFVYTYLASAPYLVFHAVRFLYAKEESSWNGHFPWLIYLMVMLFGLATIAFIADELGCASLLLIVGSVFLLIWQTALLSRAVSKKGEAIGFYKKLYRARKKPKIDASTYKHLREHGNAFSLILANLFFFVLILAVEKVFGAAVLWVVVLWVFPAAAVYFVGHQIEAGMLR